MNTLELYKFRRKNLPGAKESKNKADGIIFNEDDRKELTQIKTELQTKTEESDELQQQIKHLQTEFESKDEEIETINNDLEIRNTIIEEMKKQLTEKQTTLAEKTTTNDQLQGEL